jgi:hypothetical protein
MPCVAPAACGAAAACRALALARRIRSGARRERQRPAERADRAQEGAGVPRAVPRAVLCRRTPFSVSKQEARAAASRAAAEQLELVEGELKVLAWCYVMTCRINRSTVPNTRARSLSHTCARMRTPRAQTHTHPHTRTPTHAPTHTHPHTRARAHTPCLASRRCLWWLCCAINFSFAGMLVSSW